MGLDTLISRVHLVPSAGVGIVDFNQQIDLTNAYSRVASLIDGEFGEIRIVGTRYQDQTKGQMDPCRHTFYSCASIKLEVEGKQKSVKLHKHRLQICPVSSQEETDLIAGFLLNKIYAIHYQ